LREGDIDYFSKYSGIFSLDFRQLQEEKRDKIKNSNFNFGTGQIARQKLADTGMF